MAKSKICETLKLLSSSTKLIEGFSEEISILFNRFKDKLDTNWLIEFCNAEKTHDRLFELVILKHFSNSENIRIEKCLLETPTKPDFHLLYGDSKFVIEATSIGMPFGDSSEMKKALKIYEKDGIIKPGDYNISKLVNEYKLVGWAERSEAQLHSVSFYHFCWAFQPSLRATFIIISPFLSLFSSIAWIALTITSTVGVYAVVTGLIFSINLFMFISLIKLILKVFEWFSS